LARLPVIVGFGGIQFGWSYLFTSSISPNCLSHLLPSLKSTGCFTRSLAHLYYQPWLSTKMVSFGTTNGGEVLDALPKITAH